MKTLFAIWVAVLLSGTGATVYVNRSIDELAMQNRLQPARAVVQATAPLQATSEPELQPALGYKALNWTTTNLKVRQ